MNKTIAQDKEKPKIGIHWWLVAQDFDAVTIQASNLTEQFLGLALNSGLHCQVPKASVSRSTQRLSLLNQLESSSPSYLSCNLFHGRSRPLVSFYKGSTCKQPIVTLNCRFISSSMNNFYRTEAGMNFFRKKQSQKQSKNLQSILISGSDRFHFGCFIEICQEEI
ncbi:hypothetical protein SUGI_0806350 [Cryptomeria japonica]|nr:hypothetical protein SUGI_0806350 [Cryptomeria japonica]